LDEETIKPPKSDFDSAAKGSIAITRTSPTRKEYRKSKISTLIKNEIVYASQGTVPVASMVLSDQPVALRLADLRRHVNDIARNA